MRKRFFFSPISILFSLLVIILLASFIGEGSKDAAAYTIPGLMVGVILLDQLILNVFQFSIRSIWIFEGVITILLLSFFVRAFREIQC